MKWLFYLAVFIYMFYRAVYGAKNIETNTIYVETVNYGEDGFLTVGARKTISCKGSNKNQELKWVDPHGKVVKRLPGSRVFAQERFDQELRGRNPALVLTISNALASDSGVYECRSGSQKQSVDVCFIDPTEFIETTSEVFADIGRSITLSCQAKGVPEPRLKWSRNGDIIDDDKSSSKYKVMTKYNSQGFESLLTITSLGPEDSGEYVCLSMQESPQLESCSSTKQFNITLQVNYAPIFDGGNETEYVYGKNDEDVDLECSANGFPAPTYRWFQDRGDKLLEFDQKHIKYIQEEKKAVLTVKAGLESYGAKFKCQATNNKGESEKNFVLMKLKKPSTPNKVILNNSTESKLQFIVSCLNDELFPIEGFDIQYLKTDSRQKKPKDAEWKRAKLIEAELYEDAVDSEFEGVLVTLPDLKEETQYFVRLRTKNRAGDSTWSEPIIASTQSIAEATEKPALKTVKEKEVNYSEATFYGIFFAGGILVVAAVCMFGMRMV